MSSGEMRKRQTATATVRRSSAVCKPTVQGAHHERPTARRAEPRKFPMCASSSRCPIIQVMEENKRLVCPVCETPVKPTEPVGPPTAPPEHAVHLFFQHPL